jgi:hypothetical protein
MRRREFNAGLGAAAWPFAARPQQAGQVRTIGFAGGTAWTWTPWTVAFVERLESRMAAQTECALYEQEGV